MNEIKLLTGNKNRPEDDVLVIMPVKFVFGFLYPEAVASKGTIRAGGGVGGVSKRSSIGPGSPAVGSPATARRGTLTTPAGPGAAPPPAEDWKEMHAAVQEWSEKEGKVGKKQKRYLTLRKHFLFLGEKEKTQPKDTLSLDSYNVEHTTDRNMLEVVPLDGGGGNLFLHSFSF